MDDCSLAVGEGSFTVVLGSNGAGKSTLLRCLLGLVEPEAGNVTIFGQNPIRARSVLADVGSMLEGNRAMHWRLTVQENLFYAAALKGCIKSRITPRVDSVLDSVGLLEQKGVLVNKLSRGMQQRLSFAAAIIHQPKLLVLDEPSLGLDSESLKAIRTLLYKLKCNGASVILTTHQLELAKDIADEVVLISEGRIKDRGLPSKLFEQYAKNTYLVETNEPIPDEVLKGIIENSLALFQNGRLVVPGGSSALYECLEYLRPIPIKRILHASDSLPQAMESYGVGGGGK